MTSEYTNSHVKSGPCRPPPLFYNFRPSRLSGCWRSVVVSFFAAARAHSSAMLAFGADSLVELFSAAFVLVQFLPSLAISERRGGKIAAILLFALAALITVIAALSLAFDAQPESSALGIAVKG